MWGCGSCDSGTGCKDEDEEEVGGEDGCTAGEDSDVAMVMGDEKRRQKGLQKISSSWVWLWPGEGMGGVCESWGRCG